jgi:hypothetical protein
MGNLKGLFSLVIRRHKINRSAYMKNIVIIIEIVILILDLIKDGLSESDITTVIMNKFDVSEEFVKRFL